MEAEVLILGPRERPSRDTLTVHVLKSNLCCRCRRSASCTFAELIGGESRHCLWCPGVLPGHNNYGVRCHLSTATADHLGCTIKNLLLEALANRPVSSYACREPCKLLLDLQDGLPRNARVLLGGRLMAHSPARFCEIRGSASPRACVSQAQHQLRSRSI